MLLARTAQLLLVATLAGCPPPPPPPATPSAPTPAPLPQIHPWTQYGVGTVFLALTTVEGTAEGEAYSTETTVRWVLQAKEENFAKLLIEYTQNGKTVPIKLQIPLTTEADREEGKLLEERPAAAITVAAGTFSVVYRKLESDNGIVEEWFDPALPLPVKSITVDADGLKTVTELTRIDAN